MTEETTSTEVAERPRVSAAMLTDPANAAMTATVRQAQALANSDLVPQAYRGNVANVMVAAELAHRIGASVMAVMQSLFIIQGKPSFSSSFLIGCVNSSGRFSPMRFRFDGEGDDYGCRAVATDKATGEECVGPKVDWNMVKAEKWNAKPGSKWLTLGELMFHYRAAAFWTRIYAPEISLGMHTVEEREDIVRAEVLPAAAATATRPAALQRILDAGSGEGSASVSEGAQPANGAATEGAAESAAI